MRQTLILLLAALALVAQPAWGDVNFRRIQHHFFNSQSPAVLVAAHRAAHAHYPENSLPAIEEAIRIGVDIVELDIRLTRDQVPVLMHDARIDRTTDGEGLIADLSLAEVKALRLLDREGQPTDWQVPTLAEALQTTRNRIMVDVDLKVTQVKPIVRLVDQLRMSKQVFYYDTEYSVLLKTLFYDRDVVYMPRVYHYKNTVLADLILNPPVVHIDPSFNHPEAVESIKTRLQTRVWINALGRVDKLLSTDPEQGLVALQQLLRPGANIIQTDQPAQVLRALQQQGLHW